MSLSKIGLSEISGSLVALDDVEDVSNEEVVEIQLASGATRIGRVVQIEGKKAIIQVFEGTDGISLKNTKTKLLGHPMELALSKEILGRVFNGSGKPIDGMGEVLSLIHI